MFLNLLLQASNVKSGWLFFSHTVTLKKTDILSYCQLIPYFIFQDQSCINNMNYKSIYVVLMGLFVSSYFTRGRSKLLYSNSKVSRKTRIPESQSDKSHANLLPFFLLIPDL